MTSPADLKALVERLEKAYALGQAEISNTSFHNLLFGARDAAAALTALMAERDEALKLARGIEHFDREIWSRQARRAAFARAREIAEAWRPQSVATGFALDLELWAAAQIAAAIEAEMRSDEIQHSVQPLAELKPEVQDDADAKPLEDKV